MERHCVIVFLFVWLLVHLSSPPSSAAQVSACGDAVSGTFLKCVGDLIDAAKVNGPPSLSTELRDVLTDLAKTESYTGEKADFLKLRQWSEELKDLDPVLNRETIAFLDNAIASYNGQLRSAVSIRATAESRDISKLEPRHNIYQDYVRRKLEFLSSGEAKYYDRGPFEVVRRLLWGNALEESYFLDRKDAGQLREEIKVIDELQRLYESPPRYLSIPTINLQKNSNLFWRASVLFALGEKRTEDERKDLIESLRKLVSDFGLETSNPGHVYSYRVFDLPYDILIVGRDDRGGPIVETKDYGLLNRFYNPAQLALVACAQVDSGLVKADARSDPIVKYVDAVRDLTFHDFYVVAGSAKTDDVLGQFHDMVQRTIDSEPFKRERDSVVRRVNDNASGFAHVMASGAKSCGVEDAVRNEIYSPFDFTSKLERHRDAEDKNSVRLLVGGRLDATQAGAIVDFINKMYKNSELRLSAEKLGVDTTVYAARMQIDAD